MNRSEFMFQLAQHLADLSQAERSEALKYYQDYFDDAGPENEQRIIEELGSAEDVAASIKEGISSENAQCGEFSERGFTSGFEEGRFDAPDRYAQKKNKFDQVKSEAERRFSDFSGKFEEASGKFESKFNDFSEKYGDKFFEKNQKNEGGRTGQYRYGGSSYGSQKTQNAQNTHNTQSSYSGYHYGNSYNTSDARSNYSGGYDGAGNYMKQGQRRRRRFSGGQIALIVILIICASPILLGVGGGLLGLLAGIVFGGIGILIGIVGGLVGATLGLFFGGMGGFIGGAADCFVHPIDGILTCGVSLVCMALGLLLAVFDLWLVTKPLPAFCRWIGRVCRRIFGRKGQSA